MLPLIPLHEFEELSGNLDILRLKGCSLLSLPADTVCSCCCLQFLPAARHLQVTFLSPPWPHFLPNIAQEPSHFPLIRIPQVRDIIYKHKLRPIHFFRKKKREHKSILKPLFPNFLQFWCFQRLVLKSLGSIKSLPSVFVPYLVQIHANQLKTNKQSPVLWAVGEAAA